MAKTRIALEITEESVRAVEVSTGRTPAVVAAAEVPLPPGAARDSEVLDPDAVAVAVKQLWSRGGFRARRVVLAIASRRILVREHVAPAMKPEHLRQALPFQVQDLLPVPVAQAVLDFYPTLEHDGKIHGLLVAAVAETVETLIRTLAKARLKVDVVDLAPFGLARAAQKLAPTDCVAMVHLGDHTSCVVIVDAGVPRFVRIIPATLPTAVVRGRADAARAGAGDPSVPAPVRELALAGGTSGAADGAPSLDTPSVPTLRARASARAGSLDPVVAEMVARVHDTITFYDERPGTIRPVSGVFVSGAGFAASGMDAALGEAMRVPMLAVTAGELLPGPGAPSEGDLPLDLVPALGVLLREVPAWSRA
ncbi:type IV pilus biogenesis protein PilM [Microbacterium sp. NPDC078428]|uniref:type IV pilus biogenesis protein PilM n=1 Tax=Microbacterium sp. NPDC078428 TaxID=3364190 RepID=UPI0037C6DDC6